MTEQDGTPAGARDEEAAVEADRIEAEEIEADEESPEIAAAMAADAAQDAEAVEDSVQPKSAPEDRAERGPFDVAEVTGVRPYIDLGGVKILPRPDLHLRLEVEEATKRVVAVGLDYRGTTLQVQPFAAPRSSGLWHDIREQILEQLRRQGAKATPTTGAFGPEIFAEIPVTQEGKQGVRLARFIGVDGPRWFLRGVIAGTGATDAEAGAEIEELFRSIVVVRGSTPMPPRDLIPLTMPATASAAAQRPATA